MQTLKCIYINEIFKISRKKKIKAALIFSLLTVIAAAIAGKLFNNFAGINITGSTDFSIMVLAFLSYTFFPLFCTFICIDMFSGEFADDTIKLTLTGPASRFKVFAGKILAIASFIIVNLIFVMIISLVASLFINKNIPSLFKIFAAYIMQFFPVFIFCLMIVLISNITKGTSGTFMLSIIIFLVFIGAGLAFPHLKALLFTSFFDWYRLILGSYINYGKLLRMFLIMLGYGIMLFSAGYYLFENKDI